MTSKEALNILKINPPYLPREDKLKLFDIIENDLAKLELVEAELKLEKEKVKYVMKQLKNQDNIKEGKND